VSSSTERLSLALRVSIPRLRAVLPTCTSSGMNSCDGLMLFHTPISTIPSSLTSHLNAILMRFNAVLSKPVGKHLLLPAPPLASSNTMLIRRTNSHEGSALSATLLRFANSSMEWYLEYM